MTHRRLLRALPFLAATLLAPAPALAIGGQPGLDIAIDAPWRIEPIPDGMNAVGVAPKLVYGPIPIVVTIHDAVFDVARQNAGVGKKLPSQSLGQFDRIIVEEVGGHGPGEWPTTLVSHDDLTEIEAKYGVSKVGSEPKHELCIPAAGMTNCDQRLPIDEGKDKLDKASHEWHAVFYFTPKTAIEPGKDIMLRVTLHTHGSNGKSFAYVNNLLVHPGEAPMPRFAGGWLYGDLHYHSQGTDNDGEDGYSYRNVARAMGAMGMDFVFATDHASDGVQALGGGGDKLDALLSALDYIKDFDEARDLNSARFRWANGAIYGKAGANEIMLVDSLKAGKKAHFANYRGYGVIPQVFLGEEIDAWPFMSESDWKAGAIAWGDRQHMVWWQADDCVRIQSFAGASSKPAALVERECRGIRAKKKDGRWHLVDGQGGETHGSRQHLVYLPYSTKGDEGWVSSSTGTYGGATKTLATQLAELEGKGRAFLAHPTEGHTPDNSVGPNMVVYSRPALDMAWKSRGILGLQLWNEDARYGAGPSDAFSGIVAKKDQRKRIVYQPMMWHGFPWRWSTGGAKSKENCGDCDLRFHLYHGAFTWDAYLRKGLDPAQTKSIAWLPKGEPRKWSMAGGSDAHGDLDFRRHGRPNKCFKVEFGKITFKDWCDTPVSDTAIGKPRNLVHVGSPTGPGSGSMRRHGSRQVIDALEAGRFGVTDGPALRMVIDRNRNGKIDDADYEMGSVVDIFPGEQIPLLVEWFSTPEFGPVQRLDVYVGNKSKTFAAEGHGPDGRFGYATGKHELADRVALDDPYARDPSGVLGTGLAGAKAMHGVAKVMLDPKQFGIDGAGELFYLRAYVETKDGRGEVAGKMAYANPIWGRYHTACSDAGSQSLDGDRNGTPDVCEDKAPKKTGSTRTVAAIGGAPNKQNPTSPPTNTVPTKPTAGPASAPTGAVK
jgi:hypothetical protein